MLFLGKKGEGCWPGKQNTCPLKGPGHLQGHNRHVIKFHFPFPIPSLGHPTSPTSVTELSMLGDSPTPFFLVCVLSKENHTIQYRLSRPCSGSPPFPICPIFLHYFLGFGFLTDRMSHPTSLTWFPLCWCRLLQQLVSLKLLPSCR